MPYSPDSSPTCNCQVSANAEAGTIRAISKMQRQETRRSRFPIKFVMVPPYINRGSKNWSERSKGQCNRSETSVTLELIDRRPFRMSDDTPVGPRGAGIYFAWHRSPDQE